MAASIQSPIITFTILPLQDVPGICECVAFQLAIFVWVPPSIIPEQEWPFASWNDIKFCQ